MEGVQEVGAATTRWVSTYSPTSNSYGTRPIDETAANSNVITTLSNHRQIQATKMDDARESRSSSLTETIMDALIKGGKGNCLLTSLLIATLLASVFNILLLSFVIKSIQLDDRGFISGKITWDSRIESTVLELLTRLQDKSISLDSIESFDDKPLRIESLLSESASSSMRRRSDVDKLKTTSVFLTTSSKESGGVKVSSLLNNDNSDDYEREDFKSNYMAINNLNTFNGHLLNDGGNNKSMLEIGTKSLKMYLLMDNELNQELRATRQQASNSNVKSTIGKRRDLEKVVDTKQLLLEFDGEQQSITLPMEDKLNLNSLMSNSLIVDEQLKSSKILGSLEENLDVQTRDGNLIVKSEGTMKLMSKSAGAKITTFDRLILSAPSLNLKASNHLYIPKGIQYFDSEVEQEFQGGIGRLEAVARENSLLTQAAPVVLNQDKKEEEEEEDLRAYNLVAINGLLVAVAGEAAAIGAS